MSGFPSSIIFSQALSIDSNGFDCEPSPLVSSPVIIIENEKQQLII